MKKIKFKKFLVLFSLLICVFCMTACSSSNGTISTASAKTELKQQQLDASEAYLVDWAKDMITYLDKNDSAKITADAEAAQSLTMVNNKLLPKEVKINDFFPLILFITFILCK